MPPNNTNGSNTDKKRYNTNVLDFVPQFMAGLMSIIGGSSQPLVSPIPQGPPPPPKTQQVQSQNKSGGGKMTDTNWKDFLENKLLPLTRKEGIPDALAAAQAAGEGGRNPSVPAHFGLKPGGDLKQWSDLKDEVKMYANTVKDLSGGINPGDTASSVLRRMQTGSRRYEGDNPNPMDYVDMISSTPEFKQYNQTE